MVALYLPGLPRSVRTFGPQELRSLGLGVPEFRVQSLFEPTNGKPTKLAL